jgi:hypothetical protein
MFLFSRGVSLVEFFFTIEKVKYMELIEIMKKVL